MILVVERLQRGGAMYPGQHAKMRGDGGEV